MLHGKLFFRLVLLFVLSPECPTLWAPNTTPLTTASTPSTVPIAPYQLSPVRDIFSFLPFLFLLTFFSILSPSFSLSKIQRSVNILLKQGKVDSGGKRSRSAQCWHYLSVFVWIAAFRRFRLFLVKLHRAASRAGHSRANNYSFLLLFRAINSSIHSWIKLANISLTHPEISFSYSRKWINLIATLIVT